MGAHKLVGVLVSWCGRGFAVVTRSTGTKKNSLSGRSRPPQAHPPLRPHARSSRTAPTTPPLARNSPHAVQARTPSRRAQITHSSTHAPPIAPRRTHARLASASARAPEHRRVAPSMGTHGLWPRGTSVWQMEMAYTWRPTCGERDDEASAERRARAERESVRPISACQAGGSDFDIGDSATPLTMVQPSSS